MPAHEPRRAWTCLKCHKTVITDTGDDAADDHADECDGMLVLADDQLVSDAAA